MKICFAIRQYFDWSVIRSVESYVFVRVHIFLAQVGAYVCFCSPASCRNLVSAHQRTAKSVYFESGAMSDRMCDCPGCKECWPWIGTPDHVYGGYCVRCNGNTKSRRHNGDTHCCLCAGVKDLRVREKSYQHTSHHQKKLQIPLPCSRRMDTPMRQNYRIHTHVLRVQGKIKQLPTMMCSPN